MCGSRLICPCQSFSEMHILKIWPWVAKLCSVNYHSIFFFLKLNLRRLSQGCGLPQQPLLPSLSPPMFSPLPLLLQEAPKWALQGTQLESMQLEPRRVKQLFSRAVIQCQESQEFPSVLPVASQSGIAIVTVWFNANKLRINLSWILNWQSLYE